MPDPSVDTAAAHLSPEEFHAWFGVWDPLTPAEVARLLDGAPVRWWIAGGRAARVGAEPREHEDTDVEVVRDDVDALRQHLSDWHLWEAVDGTLRPLLPREDLRDRCRQLWLRRDAHHPWVAEFLLHDGATEWVYKRDARLRRPWAEALVVVDDVPYLRPELALLFKAKHDRPKDRADLEAAALAAETRAWLADTLDRLGHPEWAELSRTRA